MPIRQFQVVGRKTPTANDPDPQIFRMRIFATNPVSAKSRFWYFLHQLYKLKKTTGDILSINEIFEKNARIVKNFGIVLRYNSRSGTHNMYKEFRDTKLSGAVSQLYSEMASRHRARARSVQIIRTCVVPAKSVRRVGTMRFLKSGIKFPMTAQNRFPRSDDKAHRSSFKAARPSTYVG